MANINKLITLTEKNDAGSLFDVYYSTDGITYELAVDGFNVNLPSVGSTAIVSVDENTQYIKLVSKGDCTNEVILGNPFGIDCTDLVVYLNSSIDEYYDTASNELVNIMDPSNTDAYWYNWNGTYNPSDKAIYFTGSINRTAGNEYRDAIVLSGSNLDYQNKLFFESGSKTMIWRMKRRDDDYIGNYNTPTLFNYLDDAGSNEGLKFLPSGSTFKPGPGPTVPEVVSNELVWQTEGGTGYDATSSLKIDDIPNFETDWKTVAVTFTGDYTLSQTNFTMSYDEDDFVTQYNFAGEEPIGITAFNSIFRNAGVFKSFLLYNRKLTPQELTSVHTALDNNSFYCSGSTTTTTSTTTAATTTTSTTSTTSTTTSAGYYTWYLTTSGYGFANEACDGGAVSTVVYTDGIYDEILDFSDFNTRFFTDTALTNGFDGNGDYWGISDFNGGQPEAYAAIGGTGFLLVHGDCVT